MTVQNAVVEMPRCYDRNSIGDMARRKPANSEASADAPRGNTPLHSFRVSDEDWEAAKAKAEELGEVWNEELRKFVRRYSKKKP